MQLFSVPYGTYFIKRFMEGVVGSPPDGRAEAGQGAALGPGRGQDRPVPARQAHQVGIMYMH